MKNYIEQALFALRGIPDQVLLELVKDEDIAQVVMASGAPLSDPVFSRLWEIYCDHEDDAAVLLERRLTASQRALVMSTENNADILQPLIEFNDLTPAEFSALQVDTFNNVTADLLLRRHSPEDPIMASVIKKLPYWHQVLARLRSAPGVCSDDEVIDTIKEAANMPPAHEAQHDVQDQKQLIPAIRDAVEKRPHLIPRICSIFNDEKATDVRLAIAESRYIGDPKTLRAVLGCDPRGLTPGYLRNIRVSVRYALLKNPLVPIFVRCFIMHSETTRLEDYVYETTKSQISSDLTSVTSNRELHLLLDRAFSAVKPYRGDPTQDWDFLELAKNPNLPLTRVEQVYDHLVRLDVVSRLGKARCNAARRALEANYIIPTAWKGRIELNGYPSGPDSDSSVRGEALGRTYTPVNLDTPVRVVFTKDRDPLHASSLLRVLGDSPVAWVTFLAMLDTADPDSSLRKVAQTSARLVTAP